jgi:hypothetical protein
VADIVGAFVGVFVIMLPAVIYFVRAPGPHGQFDVFGAILVVYAGQAIAALFGGWAMAITWAAMCAYAWYAAGKRRA